MRKPGRVREAWEPRTRGVASPSGGVPPRRGCDRNSCRLDAGESDPLPSPRSIVEVGRGLGRGRLAARLQCALQQRPTFAGLAREDGVHLPSAKPGGRQGHVWSTSLTGEERQPVGQSTAVVDVLGVRDPVDELVPRVSRASFEPVCRLIGACFCRDVEKILARKRHQPLAFLLGPALLRRATDLSPNSSNHQTSGADPFRTLLSSALRCVSVR